MSAVTLEIRRDHEGAWRVYPRGEHAAITEKGKLLGGRYDDAIGDAERVAKANGFLFQRPSGLLMP